MRFINWYQNFMRERYGIDSLHFFMFKIVVIIFLVNIFVSSNILLLIEIVLLVIMSFRSYSKNIRKRQLENNKYLILKDKVKDMFKKKESHNIYKKCKYCKTTLRLPLPSSRGIRHTKCPNCHKRLTVFCFRKQKIEVIKNGKKVKA